MTSIRIAHIGTGLVFLVCAILILAALADFRCTALRPGDATFVLACRASRLEAGR